MEPEISAPALACPVCENPGARAIFRSAAGYPIVRCDACGLAYTDDRGAPPPSALYPPFDQTTSASMSRVRSALRVFLRQRADVVRSVKPRGRILDYGCGNGAFASYMSELGHDAVGLEPFSLGKPEIAPGLRLLRGPLETLEADLGVFDAITLWHVLEHVKSPADVLARLARHLAPGGVLVVSVPNFASWQSEVFKGSWFHLDAPRHLIHFEPETLRACLAKAGLAARGERRFLPEYGASGWIQSALNRVLPHKNYLYEVVKDRGALRTMSGASSALHLAASAVAAPILFAASLPIEAAAARSDRTAALTVIAARTS